MTRTPYDFGARGDGLTDDTNALGRWVLAGGGEIPAGTFRFDAPLRYGDGFTVERWEGKLLFGRGWPSGYGLCSRDWTRSTRGVRIDASAGGEIIYHGESDKPRKGLGLTFLDGFEINGVTVVGGVAPRGINLFSAEVRNSRRGIIRGGRMSVNSGQQGADGIHFTGSCSEIELIEVRTGSGDDSVGLTVEVPKQAGSVIERITFTRCRLDNDGHSSVKILLATFARGSAVRGITLKDCDMRTRLSKPGAGVPFILANHARTAGGVIEDITVDGGRTSVEVSEEGFPGLAAIQLESVDQMTIINHDIEYFSPMALIASDCRGLVVEGGRFTPVRPVPRSARPLFHLRECPRARIDTAGKQPAWTGQAIFSPDKDQTL